VLLGGPPSAGEDSAGSARSRVEKRRFRPDARLNRGDWGWRTAGVINNSGPCGTQTAGASIRIAAEGRLQRRFTSW